MKSLNLKEVEAYVNKNVVGFHKARLYNLKGLNLNSVLRRKNPYLYRAKNIRIASEFVTEILDALLSSSEEKTFGDFLEGLAIFVAERTAGGHKSAANGIDLEFTNNRIHYLVSIKSGPNWGNAPAHRKQEEEFGKALNVMKQSAHGKNVEAILGICYGRTTTSRIGNYEKVVGQSFWYFISENKNLYTDIVEPLGHRAKEHNDAFRSEKAKIINTFTKEFTDRFCINGAIDWKKVVEFNSSNM